MQQIDFPELGFYITSMAAFLEGSLRVKVFGFQVIRVVALKGFSRRGGDDGV